MLYEIWMEGYQMNGENGEASFEGKYEADSFLEACKKAVEDHKWGKLYNEKYNTIWGCRLFDNEADARKSFG